MPLYQIDIRPNGFMAFVDGELVAESASGNDLLAVFNQMLAASQSDAKVVFAEEGKTI